MFFASEDDVVQALTTDRTDKPLDMPILPRRARRDRPIANAHRAQAAPDNGAVTSVTVTDEMQRFIVPRKGLGDLVRDPFGCWVRRDIGPDETSSAKTQDHEPVQEIEADGWYDEQIDGGNVRGMIAQERRPCL